MLEKIKNLIFPYRKKYFELKVSYDEVVQEIKDYLEKKERIENENNNGKKGIFEKVDK